jgi:hypothetical protein
VTEPAAPRPIAMPGVERHPGPEPFDLVAAQAQRAWSGLTAAEIEGAGRSIEALMQVIQARFGGTDDAIRAMLDAHAGAGVPPSKRWAEITRCALEGWPELRPEDLVAAENSFAKLLRIIRARFGDSEVTARARLARLAAAGPPPFGHDDAQDLLTWEATARRAREVWPALSDHDLLCANRSPEKLGAVIRTRFGGEPAEILLKLGLSPSALDIDALLGVGPRGRRDPKPARKGPPTAPGATDAFGRPL